MRPQSVARLVVFKVTFLGDAVVFRPTLHALREYFRDSHLTLVTSPIGAEVLGDPGLADEVWTLPLPDVRRLHRSPTALLAWTQRLRRGRFDLALAAQDQRSNIALLAWLARIPRRVGYRGRSQLAFLHSHLLPAGTRGNMVEEEFTLYWAVSGDPLRQPRRVPIAVGPADRQRVDERLAAQGLLGKDFLALHPGAKFETKRWPLERFIAVADRLWHEVGWPTVVLLGPVEASWKDRLTEVRGGANRFTPRSQFGGNLWVWDDLTVQQTCWLLHRAKLFLGCNSGPMNLAAAMGTPTIVVQGPSPPIWDVYWRDVPHRKVVRNDLPCVPCEGRLAHPGECVNYEKPLACMHEIAMEEVWAAVEEALNR